jgi:hypothetical protein
LEVNVPWKQVVDPIDRMIGNTVEEICRKAGISQTTYLKYAGLLPDEMRRLKALCNSP